MIAVGKHRDPSARLEAMRRDLAHSLYPDQSRFHARKLCVAAGIPIPAWAERKPRHRNSFVRAPAAAPTAIAVVLEVPSAIPEELRAWRARTRGACIQISRSRGVVLDVIGGDMRTFATIADAVEAVSRGA